MRFAFLSSGDPLSESLWSGIPLNVARTLRDAGHEVDPVGNLQPQAPLSSRFKGALYKYLFRKVYLIGRDLRVMRARADEGSRRLKNMGKVDAVVVTYSPDAAYLETSAPVILLSDMTLLQILDYYPGFERKRLAAETLRDAWSLDRMALRRCTHAVFSSHWAAESAVREYSLPPPKVSVAPFGASITNAPTRADLACYLSQRGLATMKLLFVGKEWYRKGGDIAVQVATEIDRLGVPVELHIVGCRAEGVIPDFLRSHGSLKKNVQHEAEELRKLFESSDFLIVPTRADAFGIVFAESAAFGLPVMAADTGGVQEAVRGEWGITPPPQSSPAHYAQWAVNLFHNRAEYERLSWLARECYENELNWSSYCRHLVQVVADSTFPQPTLSQESQRSKPVLTLT
jgi:glycosyltransferase involved in cell wall biosynthesis